MKETRITRAIDLLLDAYNNDELEHGDCRKCCAGNILDTHVWSNKFVTSSGGFQMIAKSDEIITFNSERFFITKLNEISDPEQHQAALENLKYYEYIISESEFTEKELMEIENVFEKSISHSRALYTVVRPKEGQLIGLTAVMNLINSWEESPLEEEKLKETIDNKISEKYKCHIK